MTENDILHEACQKPISQAEEKAIVDKWLRSVRSKGGKSRWKNHEPAPKDRPAPPAVHPTRWATRRENRFRSTLKDGVSHWIRDIRLLAETEEMEERLEARYTFHSRKYRATFPTKDGFHKAWSQAQSWIYAKSKQARMGPVEDEEPDDKRERIMRSRVKKNGVSSFCWNIRLILDYNGEGEVLEAVLGEASQTFKTSEGFYDAWVRAKTWIVQKRKEVKAQRTAKKKEKA